MASRSQKTAKAIGGFSPLASSEDVSNDGKTVAAPEVESKIPKSKSVSKKHALGADEDSESQSSALSSESGLSGLPDDEREETARDRKRKRPAKQKRKSDAIRIRQSPDTLPVDEIDNMQQAVLASSQVDSSVPLEHLITELGFSSAETPATLPPSLVSALRNRLSESYLTSPIEATKTIFSPRYTLPTFVFDPLMFPAIVSHVLGNLPREKVARCMTPARIKGYKLCAVKHETFPAAFPSFEPSDEIRGMLIFGMDCQDRRRRVERFQERRHHLQRGIAEIVSAEGTVLRHEVILHVWAGPSSDLVIPSEGDGEGKKWSASKMMRDRWGRGLIEGNGEVIPECPG